MAITFVAGADQGILDHASISTVSFNLTVGAYNTVYAFIAHNGTISSVPSGWVLVSSPGSFTDGTLTMTLSIYKRTATTAATLAPSWGQTSPTGGGNHRMRGHAMALSSTRGWAIDLSETGFAAVNDTATYTVTPPSLVATGNEMFIMIAVANDGSGSGVSVPAGATQFGLTGAYRPFIDGAYQTRAAAESNSGDFVMTTGTPGSANGLMAVTLRFSEALYDTVADGIDVNYEVGDVKAIIARDTVNTADTLGTGQPVGVGDPISISLTPVIALATIVSEAPTIADTLRYDYGAIMSEVLRVTSVMLGTGIYPRSFSDLIRVTEQVMRGMPETVAETVSVTEVMRAVLGITVAEELGLTPTITAAAKYTKSVAEAIALTDALNKFLSGALVEALTVQPVVADLRKSPSSVSETLTLTAGLTPHVVFRITVADGVDFDDAQVITAILTGAITEAIEIAAAYISPDGNFTTWAVNSRTGAVTEYDNFVFNSFAKSGRKYLGANSDGVYELNGDDDAGTDIVAQIKSGMLQFAGARLTSFKAIYLATRGGGDFVLKLETGDGKTFTYNVKSNSLQTAKIRVGKGLRARYFSYELISTGQDFDLESLEFVPIVAQRRV